MKIRGYLKTLGIGLTIFLFSCNSKAINGTESLENSIDKASNVDNEHLQFSVKKDTFFNFSTKRIINRRGNPFYEFTKYQNEKLYEFKNIFYANSTVSSYYYNIYGITKSIEKERLGNNKVEKEFTYDSIGQIKQIDIVHFKNGTKSYSTNENYKYSNGSLDTLIYSKTHYIKNGDKIIASLVIVDHEYDYLNRLLKTIVSLKVQGSKERVDTINYQYAGKSKYPKKVSKSISDGFEYSINDIGEGVFNFKKTYSRDGFINITSIHSKYDSLERIVYYEVDDESILEDGTILKGYEKIELNYSDEEIMIPLPELLSKEYASIIDVKTYFYTHVQNSYYSELRIATPYKKGYIPEEIKWFLSNDGKNWKRLKKTTYK